MAPSRILIIGDAISRGSNRDATGALPSTIDPSWRYWLWRSLRDHGRDIDFVGPQTFPDFPDPPWTFDQGNAVYGGNTTTGWIAARIDDPILSAVPVVDIAIIFLGTQDAFAQVPVSTRIDNLRTIIDALRRKNTSIQIVLVQIPPTTDGANGEYRTKMQIRPYNAALANLAAMVTTSASQVLVADCEVGWVASYSDATGLKPSETGHRFISQKLLAIVDPLLAGVGPTIPVEDPVYGPREVIARFAASRVDGSYPLTVQFSDTSLCDRKKMWREVIVLPGIPPAFVEQVRKFVPDYLFDLPLGSGDEGSNWQMTDLHFSGGGVIHVPFPMVPNTVVISKVSHTGATWKTVRGGAVDTRATVAVSDEELAAGMYERIGQRVLHELLHTVAGLESSDDMRTSEGFVGWLQEHPSDIGAAFLEDRLRYWSDEIEGLFYAYLVEKYWLDPILDSGQVSYVWTFGDGGTSTERHPSHTYTGAGSFPVTLKVTNFWNTSTTPAVVVTVREPDAPPVADFRVTADRGEAPFGVQFYDTSTGGTATSWAWDFGDGTVGSTQQNPTHVYLGAGVYSPSLTVTNSGGSDDITKEYFITVLREPSPAPAVHELAPSGYLDLLTMLEDAFLWAEMRDANGNAIGSRISTVGRISWAVHPDTLYATMVIRFFGTDVPTLPYTLSGIAFYEAETGGSPLTIETFRGAAEGEAWPAFEYADDILDVTVIINVLADTVVPRIANITLENTSGELGSAMIVRFKVENIGSGWKIVLDEVSPVVIEGGRIRFSIRVVKDT